MMTHLAAAEHFARIRAEIARALREQRELDRREWPGAAMPTPAPCFSHARDRIFTPNGGEGADRA